MTFAQWSFSKSYTTVLNQWNGSKFVLMFTPAANGVSLHEIEWFKVDKRKDQMFPKTNFLLENIQLHLQVMPI